MKAIDFSAEMVKATIKKEKTMIRMPVKNLICAYNIKVMKVVVGGFRTKKN